MFYHDNQIEQSAKTLEEKQDVLVGKQLFEG
jgi:hypothetical protein